MSYDREHDISFVSSLDVWRQRLSSPIVYCATVPHVVASSFPDWISTGRRVMSFYEYVRRQEIVVEPSAPIDVKPHSVTSTGIFPTQNIFPYYLGKALRYDPTLRKGAVFTMVKDGPYATLGPFIPRLWRLSVIMSDQSFSLLQYNFHNLKTCPEGYETSFTYIPWDIPESLFLLNERKDATDLMLFLRHKFITDTPIKDSDKSRRFVLFGKTHSLMESLALQKEFIYPFITQGSFKLGRTQSSSEIGYLRKFPNLIRERDIWLKQGWYSYPSYFKQKALSASRDLGFT